VGWPDGPWWKHGALLGPESGGACSRLTGQGPRELMTFEFSTRPYPVPQSAHCFRPSSERHARCGLSNLQRTRQRSPNVFAVREASPMSLPTRRGMDGGSHSGGFGGLKRPARPLERSQFARAGHDGLGSHGAPPESRKCRRGRSASSDRGIALPCAYKQAENYVAIGIHGSRQQRTTGDDHDSGGVVCPRTTADWW